MANKVPLVVGGDPIQQLQSADVLADINGVRYVRGPSSATDHAIARYDLTTGILLQDSPATLADGGAVAVTTSIASGTPQRMVLVTDGGASTCFELWISHSTQENLGIGTGAGDAITSGLSNICIGTGAGGAITASTSNICIGSNAGSALTTDAGRRSTFIGTRAGQHATGTNNIGVGFQACRGGGAGTFSGSTNVCFGNQTGVALTTGFGNFFCGDSVGGSCTTGSDNVAMGNTAMAGLTEGEDNVGVGLEAGRSITTGDNNVFVGSTAGFNGSQKVDAVNSIAIGQGTFTTADNQIVLGNTSITQTILRGDVHIEDAEDIVFDTSTGSKIATSVSQKIAFWNATPIVQPAHADQAAVSLDLDVTGADTVDLAAVNANFTEIETLLNRLRADLVSAGLIKGAA